MGWEHDALVETAGRPAKTAAGLVEAFVHRIAAGEYREGDLLPSCREAARDLHVDKNTVNKAYRTLKQMGIVRAAPGRGVIVVRNPRAQLPVEQLRQSIEAIVWRARALGMDEDTLWNILSEAIGRFYGLTKVRVAFMECNDYEIEYFAHLLEEELRLPIGRVCLTDFIAAPARFTDAYDILVTSVNHLAAALTEAGNAQHKILGVHLIPVMGDVLRVAAIPRGSRAAVVCTAEPTISLLHNLVRTYNTQMEIIPCLADDRAALASAIASADLIVDTGTSHAQVMALAPKAPALTVSFEMDAQSLNSVKSRVLELTRARLEQARQPQTEACAGAAGDAAGGMKHE